MMSLQKNRKMFDVCERQQHGKFVHESCKDSLFVRRTYKTTTTCPYKVLPLAMQ